MIEGVAVGTAVSFFGSAEPNRTWVGQWMRMLRSLERMQAPPTSSFVYADVEDAVVHFFQDAWHLKDWLLKDPASGALVDADIEGEVNRVLELKIVADVANATKHLGLSPKWKPRTGNLNTALGVLTFGGDPTVGMDSSFDIRSGDERYDALSVAVGAVGAWRRYLESKGLHPPD